jgi:hypothetical protein
MAAFEEAGKELGLTVPTDLSGLTSLVLSNDQFSMRTAAIVIKETWEAAGGDWSSFTYKYVGPGIPAADFERRKIYG